LTIIDPGHAQRVNQRYNLPNLTKAGAFVEIVLYTIVGVFLYFFSDFVLVQAEYWYGKPFKHRNIIFFLIISVLAIGSFRLLKYLLVTG